MSLSPSTRKISDRALWLAGAVLVLAALAAYSNSFTGPFVFDDVPAIKDNPSIRQLWPLSAVLSPQLDGGVTVSGRPLVNLSLALNYTVGREAVGGYHFVNLLIHMLAGLVLFGVVRRTFLQRPFAARFGPVARPLGLFVALLWLLHPLQTAAVTYVVQRAESLMGLCYLLTLYGFIRAVASARAGRWFWFSFVGCLAGMACKEVMASAPVIVFVYDRTFVAGTFAEAWRRRWRYYLGLAGTWLLLAYLVAGTSGRGGTAGFGTQISAWSYALTQCRAVVDYLGLALWPSPLVFDYGTATVGRVSDVWPQAVLLIALVAGTIVALVRRPVWGFFGLFFFVVLAPSSSVVPVASQTMAEHRMYLPLAAVVVGAVAGLYALFGRSSFLVCGALAVGCGWLTVLRNADYRSDLTLWADTVAKRPANGRAHNNLGKAIFAAGRPADALGHYENAIHLQPTVPEPYYNLGLALARLNRSAEAIGQYEAALRFQPNYPDAHTNLGNALLEKGRLDEAGEHYEAAIRLRPKSPQAHSNLANVRLEQGRTAEAIRQGEEAVQLDPDFFEARYNLGNALAQAGQLPQARDHYEAALRLQPDHVEVCNNLGNVLIGLERLPEAIERYEQALRLRPDYIDPRRNVAAVLGHLGRTQEAISHLRILVQLRPDDQLARAELARLLGQGRR